MFHFFPAPQSGRPAIAVLVAACAALLAACGGGGGGGDDTAAEDGARGPTAGRMMPAAQGLTLVEYDAAGQEVQRSTVTDSNGGFTFSRPVTHSRVETLAQTVGLRLPVMRSAMSANSGTDLEITPATTMFDQFVSAGLSRAAARAHVRQLVGAHCGADAGAAIDAALAGESALSSPARDWLLPALDAYLEAMRNVGLAPTTPGIDWPARLQQRGELLGQMCGVARSLWSDDWLTQARYTVAGQRRLAVTSTTLDSLSTTRPHVTAQLLALIGARMAALEFPQLQGLMQERAQSWQGNETGLAVSLANTQLDRIARPSTDSQAVIAAAGTPTPAPAPAVLDPRGNIISALTATVAAAPSGNAATLRLQNTGSVDRLVKLDIDATSLQDFDGVLADVLAIPAARADELLHRRAWRYVFERTRHDWPLSAGMFLHQPDMFLRSVGAGLCDDVSSALYWIWTGMGYESRVRSLEGHVVPEVKIDGRWEDYDPDFGVFYVNREGLVAGVDELAADPKLITQPLLPMVPLWSTAYSQYLADIYASTSDNFIYPPYTAPLQAMLGNQFPIAAGGYLDVLANATITLPTWGGGTVTLAPMRLWLPPGYTGTLNLPMVLADVAGDASMRMLDRQIDVGANGVAGIISDYYLTSPDVGIASVRFDRVGADGVTLTLLANPLLFKASGTLTVSAYADDLSGMALVNPAVKARR